MHRVRCAFGLVLLPALAATSAAQQRTLVVDAAAGPFFDLPPAVAASRPGDRIEVHAAAVPYSYTTITTGLDIDAQAGAVVGGLQVYLLAPYHAVRVEGLTVRGSITTMGTFNGLIVDFCQGPVHLHRVTAGGISISTSSRVLLSDCTITGVDGLRPTSPGALGVGVSSVVATRCSVHGYDAIPGAGQNAIQLTNGTLTLVDCTVTGGNGGVPLNCGTGGQVPGAGGDAITGTGSVVAIGTSALHGGAGGSCGVLTAPGGVAAGPAVSLRLGPAVTLAGTTGSPPVAIGEPPLLGVSTLLLQGGVAQIAVTTVPAAVVLLGIDIWHDLQPLSGSELPILLPLTSASLAGIAVADGAGQAQFAFPLPTAPWIANQFLVLQGAVFAGSSAMQLTSPGVARIR